MKPKTLHLEAYTISETARRLGYKSTKTIYQLLKRDLLEDYVYLEKSGRVYLVLEPQNLPSLAEKISGNIQFKKYIYPFVEGPLELAQVPKDANEMTLKQAIKAEKIYKKTGNLKELRRIKVRIQEKFTLPFACLVFGLIGSSLGSKSNLRSSKSQGFGLSVILILIYYVMSFIFSSFGVKGI